MDLKYKIKLFEEKIKRYEHIIDEFLPLPPEVEKFYRETKAIYVPKKTEVYVAFGGDCWDEGTNIETVFDSLKKAKKHEQKYEDSKEHWACYQKVKIK